MSNIDHLTRRGALVGGIALVGLVGSAAAASSDQSSAETEHVTLVDTFFKAWNDRSATAAKLADFLAEDCTMRLDENGPPVLGRANAEKVFAGLLKDGQRVAINITETFAKGPVVAHFRSDQFMVGGKPRGPQMNVVGVLVIRNGKIKEFYDFLVKT